MSNEATIRSSLIILKDDGSGTTLLQYAGQPTAFQADVTGTFGPTPGAFAASTAGTDVDLTELTTPGLCRIMNQDDTNYVTVGMWDPEGSTFYPMMELLPGETYVFRLSRSIEEEYSTGTGTTGANTNRLRIKADTAACNVLVEAFEA
jgi:hypothetical protein